jgi:FkbM family methyltransferase
MLFDFKQLFAKYNIHSAGVLQIGSNDAHDEIQIYRDLGINKMVFIEADPISFQRLKLNIAIHYPHAIALNICVSDEEKEVIFNISSNNGESSSILEFGTHSIAHPDVTYIDAILTNTKRIDSLEGLDGLDFLNIDVQGYELPVLRGMGELLHQFKSVYIEVNKIEVYKGCALIGDIDAHLLSFGFRRVELFNNGGFFDRLGWSDAFYIK